MANRRRGKGRGWRFSARERRAILFLLPLVAVAVWILWSVAHPGYDDSVTILGDRIAVQGRENRRTHDNGDRVREEDGNGAILSIFDPNTVTYEEMRSMGIAPNTAAGIVKYRQRGKVFGIPEDFATCYSITDSMYAALKPYIRIGEEYRLPEASSNRAAGAGKPSAERVADDRPEAVFSEFFDPNVCTVADFCRLGFSERQAGVIIRFRDSRGGFRSAEEFAECYVVSDEMFAMLRDRIVIAPIAGATEQAAGIAGGTEAASPGRAKREKTDLNSADSLELVSVRGIGPRTASDIIAYREKLGGFHSVWQLKELRVMNERNYETIVEQIWADSSKIQKIDINFATPNAVSKHPYISGKQLRRILKNRQLKGGWSTIEDMVEDNTLTPEEAARVAPYLLFNVQP